MAHALATAQPKKAWYQQSQLLIHRRCADERAEPTGEGWCLRARGGLYMRAFGAAVSCLVACLLVAQSPRPAGSVSALEHGHCRIALGGTIDYTTGASTTLTLKPYNGSGLVINGAQVNVPGRGVSITNTRLSAATLYYVYAYTNSGSVALELSTTGHATSTTAGNVGIEIKSGDDSRTLVGMVYTNAKAKFQDFTGDNSSPAVRTVLNWFNRRDLFFAGPGSGSVGCSTSSTSFVELCSSIWRMTMLSWSDEAVIVGFNGIANNDTAGGRVNAVLASLGHPDTPITSWFGTTSAAAHQFQNLSSNSTMLMNLGTDGVSIVTLYAHVGGGTGGTASIYGNPYGMTRG